MRIVREYTEIECDTCGSTIHPNTNIHGVNRNYFNFKAIELCQTCAINILEDIMNTQSITEDKFKDLIDDYKDSYRCPKPGITLCGHAYTATQF